MGRYYQFGYWRNGNFYRLTVRAESLTAAIDQFKEDTQYDEIVSVNEI